MDISFHYYRAWLRPNLPKQVELAAFIDLFNAPEVLLETGAFGDSYDRLRQLGFIPSFVRAFRETFGSESGSSVDLSEMSPAERLATIEAMAEAALEGLLAGEGLGDERVDVSFPADEALRWAELWLDLIDDGQLQADSELGRALLPITHRHFTAIERDLRDLRAQAQAAMKAHLKLRMVAECS